MRKCLSVNFWICCNSLHSEQMSQWAQCDSMGRFFYGLCYKPWKVQILHNFIRPFKAWYSAEMFHRIKLCPFVQNEENYNRSKNYPNLQKAIFIKLMRSHFRYLFVTTVMGGKVNEFIILFTDVYMILYDSDCCRYYSC